MNCCKCNSLEVDGTSKQLRLQVFRIMVIYSGVARGGDGGGPPRAALFGGRQN